MMGLSLHCVGLYGAERIRALVQALDLARLPASLLKLKPQPWDLVYTLTVEDGAHQVRFHNRQCTGSVG